MKRRVIAFDLDNTLADSKSPVTKPMADRLDRLLHSFQVCVISGGKFEQFEEQPTKLWGAQIEDRGSQVTFSALGQDAPTASKSAWDRHGSKKRKLRDYVANLIPEFEVRVGGSTSIDVTRPGIDKAYGIAKLIELLALTKRDVIFVGDRLSSGGNDHPVKAMGVDCLEVSCWQDTELVIQTILDVT